MENGATTSTRTSPSWVLAAVGFAVFVAADDLTVVTTMLRPMINDVGLTLPDGLDDAAWVVNVYLIAFVAVMPLAGRLSDTLGRRTLLLGAYSIFLVGTVVIPLSSDLTTLLVGRVLTALGGGAMLPVALAVVGDVFAGARRARALGTLGAIETLGWVWGPLYGAMLVRFLDWRWQFWLNIPLALAGMLALWWVLPGGDDERQPSPTDWTGAILLALTLIALDVALLGDAEVQSVSGLEELQGGPGFSFLWLLPVAAVLLGGFVLHQRRARDPIIEPAFYRGRALQISLGVNFVVGAALVIAMVDVPLFVNALETDLERAAVRSGWLLAALTASMAVSSLLGGRMTARFGYRIPTATGLVAAAVALSLMGLSWDPEIGNAPAATQLALLGAGLGLVFAPTTAAVVDAAPYDRRGSAAAIVMIVRLIGLSVGLAGLTAWGLARFNAQRQDLQLPPISDPGFESAVLDATARLTADAISETFLAAALLLVIGVVAALTMPATSSSRGDPHMPTSARNSLIAAVAIIAIGMIATLLWTRSVAAELDDTRRELTATQAELDRVEEGAAGSAIVAAQVLDISRQLAEIAPSVDSGLSEAIQELESFGDSTIEFQVPIDETIDFNTDITIDRNFTFPVDETVTIDQTVRTTITVDTGLGFEVPVDVEVPVQVDVPIQLDVEVPIRETIPVSAVVPVRLDVPIEVDVAETELNALADQLASSLRTVQQLLSELAG
ncbi:MAG: MFS transporter [Acidimicrobiales bacterium]|nr:MFS transporter [Acidimicrobiales bacterium]